MSRTFARLAKSAVSVLGILSLACAARVDADTAAPSQAAAVPEAGMTAPGQSDPAVDRVLDGLQQVGQDLHSFTADVTMTVIDNSMGNEYSHAGTVAYQLKANGDARIHVVFTRKTQKGKTYNDKREYLLDDGVLTILDYHRSVETQDQVAKPWQKINLMKLGEGPFPLPIGQDKQDVYRQFDVKLIPPQADDPKGTAHLSLLPKPASNFHRKFSSIDVYVDEQSHMPVRIDTVDANKANTQQTVFTNMRVNPPVADADFALPPVVGWQVQHNDLNSPQ